MARQKLGQNFNGAPWPGLAGSVSPAGAQLMKMRAEVGLAVVVVAIGDSDNIKLNYRAGPGSAVGAGRSLGPAELELDGPSST